MADEMEVTGEEGGGNQNVPQEEKGGICNLTKESQEINEKWIQDNFSTWNERKDGELMGYLGFLIDERFDDLQSVCDCPDSTWNDLKLPKAFLGKVRKLAMQECPEDSKGFEIAKYVEQLMPSKNGKRRVSLEAEKERLPETLKRKNLGVYLKFVNRERSINELLKHAVIYYQNYFMGSSDEKECPFPACSGGPGLGKTTFCRKAFTKAIDAPAEGEEAQIMWDGVPSDFKEVVECCVEQGRQYRISYASPAVQPAEYQKENWARSFAFRLGVVYAKSQKTFPLEWDKLPTGSLLVEAVIKQITGSKKEAMIVVNLDETNVLLSHTDGVQYLKGVLGVVKEFNRKGFGFVYVILSGTNVKTLNEMLRDSSSGTHPVEIPLPLLEDHHVNEVLYDLARRSCGKEMQKKSSQALDFVIGVLGGVPRYVEMLVFLIGSNGKDFLTDRYSEVLYSEEFPAHDILEKVKETISALYGSTYTTTVASIQRPRALLAYSLFGWYVMRDEALFGVKTVAELESLGVVFLQGVEPAATLRLPLILLLFISNSTFSSRELPMLLKHFTVLVSPQESERVMFAIIWLKCAARIECGDLVRVDDLFPINKFPCLNPFWAKCSFTLDPNCILRDCTTRIYQNNWESVFQQFRATGALIVNGAGAPFADLILIPKDGAFAIFFQEKQREKAKQKNLSAQKIPTLALATVLSEHQKCEVETPHLFVMNTDEGFAEQSQLADNEVVLSCQDHVDLMGKLLSQLRLFNSIQSKPLIISEDP